MKEKKIKRNSIQLVYDWVLILVAVILTGNPLGSMFYSQLTIVFFVLILINIFFRINVKFNLKIFIYIAVLCCLSIFSALVNLDTDFTHYIGIIFSHVAVLFGVALIDYRTFRSIYTRIVIIIALYSSIITLYLNLIDINLLFSFPEISGWRTIAFIYNAWGTNSWTTTVRNSGFFREPGVMAMHVCIAGILLLGKIKNHSSFAKRDWMSFIVLIIAGVLTLSTVGVLGAFLLVILFFAKLDHLKKIDFIILVCFFIVALIILASNFDVLFSKFNSNHSSFISLTDRVSGILSALNVALKNPIFGAGYTVYHNLASSVVTFYFVDLWGKYGIFYPLIVTFGIYSFVKSETNRIIERLVVVLILAFFLISQGFADNPIFIFIELYGISKSKKEQIKINYDVYDYRSKL